MKHNASTLGRRAAATAGALTLALLGLASTAQAEDPNYGNIKDNAVGSLTIYKHFIGNGNPSAPPTAPLRTMRTRVSLSRASSSPPTRSPTSI